MHAGVFLPPPFIALRSANIPGAFTSQGSIDLFRIAPHTQPYSAAPGQLGLTFTITGSRTCDYLGPFCVGVVSWLTDLRGPIYYGNNAMSD